MIISPEKHEPHASYRVKRGSKLEDMQSGPMAPVSPLSSFDGPFQLAEYLSHKVRHDPHDIKGLVEVPSDNAKAADRHVWIYEHLRRIPIDVTPLITQLVTLCSRESCPEMKADEWQYLCVAHGGEGTDRCCAIDYILHTLDSTSALLNSSNYFPSRLQIPHASLAHFPSLFRRLSRIFSHAYFHHPEAFATSESETALYARFVALCHRYELVGQSLLIIPKEGYEALSPDDDHDDRDDDDDDDDDDDEEGAHDDEDRDSDDDDDDDLRGRDKDDSPGSGRSHSLGRHPSPYQASPSKWSASPVQPANKGKPAPAQASETRSPPSTRAALEAAAEANAAAASASALPNNGRGTLSRGKAPRGTTVWSQASEEGEAGDITVTEGEGSTIGMARKESVDSVVYVGPAGDGDSGSSPDSNSSSPRNPTSMGEAGEALAKGSSPKTLLRNIAQSSPKGSPPKTAPSTVSPKGISPPKSASPPPKVEPEAKVDITPAVGQTTGSPLGTPSFPKSGVNTDSPRTSALTAVRPRPTADEDPAADWLTAGDEGAKPLLLGSTQSSTMAGSPASTKTAPAAESATSPSKNTPSLPPLPEPTPLLPPASPHGEMLISPKSSAPALAASPKKPEGKSDLKADLAEFSLAAPPSQGASPSKSTLTDKPAAALSKSPGHTFNSVAPPQGGNNGGGGGGNKRRKNKNKNKGSVPVSPRNKGSPAGGSASASSDEGKA